MSDATMDKSLFDATVDVLTGLVDDPEKAQAIKAELSKAQEEKEKACLAEILNRHN